MSRLYRYVRRHVLHRLVRKGRLQCQLSGPIEVVGRISEHSGIGESARLCIANLKASGFDVVELDVDRPEQRSHQARSLPHVRIFHLNPPMMPRGILAVGFRNFHRSFNIGFWAWELEVLPIEWVLASRYMSALFAPSDFTANAVRTSCSIPVATVLHPLNERSAEKGVRQRLGIPSEAFLVTSVMNLSSSAERKNPEGSLRAFREYSILDPNAWLVLKVSDLEKSSAAIGLFRDSEGLERVRVIDEHWPPERVSGLIKESDVYLSLHRSEGFGLTIAEAIMSNVPVIATGWSGNLDFCDPLSTWLVNSHQIAADSKHPEIADTRGACWAEPSLEQASGFLREIRLNQAAARNRAATAHRYLIDALAVKTYSRALGDLVQR